MRRSTLAVVGGAAAAALLATTVSSTAVAAPASGAPAAAPAPQGAERVDDRPDPVVAEQRALQQEAVSMVLSGEATPQQRGGGKSVRVAPGQWVQYGTQKTDQLLTFLVEFGDQADPRFPDAPASGPEAGQIPEPDRSVDNSTYWEADLGRDHFMDMFFDARGDGGDSFKGVYEELSSGRYTVEGDVSDWVTVPYSSASYGMTESQTDMTRFIQDSADAWYADQLATGKTPAEVDEYLATFDQWDRYDYDGDGVFDEPDGYIDHFQAVRAGEDESAGAPEWMIWAHRWSVGQRGYGTDGPDFNKFGGVQVGESSFWIRDYTTEPENGGLGVFAHEYAHDLGLPDLYDTSGGENGTGFWTLMSSGSWLGDGDGAIGTVPNHMGAWEKLQLGWLDYEVARAGEKSTHQLGVAEHATKKPQALVVDLGPDAAGNDRFYLAENRQYVGYDRTLATGPYNFGWPLSSPDRVEHFPYQNGLSVTYWNTAFTNNQTLRHPGEGLALPVDARPAALRWSDGTVARNRIQTFDATFGTEATDPISLHRETAAGMTTLDVPSRPAVSVFDDSDPMAYYDPAAPQNSVKVAGTGTQIRVVQANRNGFMTVQVR
ncbi:immune inhibitor A domain-containing protein [Pseudokineococcus marinus]|uniref:immune inhibitor A domain-containing protein n=1 Tax=Pseudokineococcus marinus TaxID=351215 RepID=UPI002ADD7642|nr:immune inhibitor A domain-containing protein [Pseudokineococcus marinus]